MSLESLLVLITLLVLLIASVFFDLTRNKIPNALVFPFWFISPLLHFFLSGASGLGSSLAGLGVAFAVSLPFWLLKWMGAGDVKLIAAVGALLGWPLALPMLAGVGISGAFLALITLGFKGALGRTVERYSASLTLSIAQRKIVFIEAQGKDASIQLPYAVAIAAGSLVVYLNELHIVNLW